MLDRSPQGQTPRGTRGSSPKRSVRGTNPVWSGVLHYFPQSSPPLAMACPPSMMNTSPTQFPLHPSTSFIHTFIHSFIHSFIYSFIHLQHQQHTTHNTNTQQPFHYSKKKKKRKKLTLLQKLTLLWKKKIAFTDRCIHSLFSELFRSKIVIKIENGIFSFCCTFILSKIMLYWNL